MTQQEYEDAAECAKYWKRADHERRTDFGGILVAPETVKSVPILRALLNEAGIVTRWTDEPSPGYANIAMRMLVSPCGLKIDVVGGGAWLCNGPIEATFYTRASFPDMVALIRREISQ